MSEEASATGGNGGSPAVREPAGRLAWSLASTAASALRSAASAARRACRAASSAISPTSRTPSSEARAITTASSIRASSSLTRGTLPRGTTQSWVVSRSSASIVANLGGREAANSRSH